jgi:hypothetical protein
MHGAGGAMVRFIRPSAPEPKALILSTTVRGFGRQPNDNDTTVQGHMRPAMIREIDY